MSFSPSLVYLSCAHCDDASYIIHLISKTIVFDVICIILQTANLSPLFLSKTLFDFKKLIYNICIIFTILNFLTNHLYFVVVLLVVVVVFLVSCSFFYYSYYYYLSFFSYLPHLSLSSYPLCHHQ